VHLPPPPHQMGSSDVNKASAQVFKLNNKWHKLSLNGSDANSTKESETEKTTSLQDVLLKEVS
jgi:hypothetical protein